jgi:hypothetical protein
VQAALRKALAHKGAQARIVAEAGIDAGPLSHFKKTGKGLSKDALGGLVKVLMKKK